MIAGHFSYRKDLQIVPSQYDVSRLNRETRSDWPTVFAWAIAIDRRNVKNNWIWPKPYAADLPKLLTAPSKYISLESVAIFKEGGA